MVIIMRRKQMQTKLIVLMGLFIAMSVVGGYVKVPNPVTSSVAFDSLPAFLATLVLGGIPGAVVGFLGHMSSAAVGGFPLTLPIHLFIGLQMAIIMLVFGFVAKRINLILAIIVGIFLNGVAAPACFILFPSMGMAVFLDLIIPLSIASILNILVASLVYGGIKNAAMVKSFQEE
jgi:riboflavin transporter